MPPDEQCPSPKTPLPSHTHIERPQAYASPVPQDSNSSPQYQSAIVSVTPGNNQHLTSQKSDEYSPQETLQNTPNMPKFSTQHSLAVASDSKLHTPQGSPTDTQQMLTRSQQLSIDTQCLLSDSQCLLSRPNTSQPVLQDTKISPVPPTSRVSLPQAQPVLQSNPQSSVKPQSVLQSNPQSNVKPQSVLQSNPQSRVTIRPAQTWYNPYNMTINTSEQKKIGIQSTVTSLSPTHTPMEVHTGQQHLIMFQHTGLHSSNMLHGKMSCVMSKPAFCMCENKGAI